MEDFIPVFDFPSSPLPFSLSSSPLEFSDFPQFPGYQNFPEFPTEQENSTNQEIPSEAENQALPQANSSSTSQLSLSSCSSDSNDSSYGEFSSFSSRRSAPPSENSQDAEKRAKNAFSASQYRQRRKHYVRDLEEKVRLLEAAVAAGERKIAKLEDEKKLFLAQLKTATTTKIQKDKIPEKFRPGPPLYEPNPMADLGEASELRGRGPRQSKKRFLGQIALNAVMLSVMILALIGSFLVGDEPAAAGFPGRRLLSFDDSPQTATVTGLGKLYENWNNSTGR